uniref:Homolog of Odr-2 (Two) n=1 Tax=Steinernema glaseri TaxID=37863 RepID=A0A1I8ATX4_9BILA
MLDRVVLVTVAAAAAAASVAAAVFDDDFGSYWPSSAQAQPNGFRDADDAGFSLQYAQTLFGDKPATDSARCFSCMSRFYEAVWPALSHVYKRPRNFTDYCNDDVVDPRHVPVVDCPTICIRMWEEPTVAGVRIRGHIRGCLDDLLHNGFNQTIVTWYRWMHRDSCRQYRKRELFMLNADESDDSYVNVCTCYADHCNSAGSASRATVTLATAATTFLLVLAVRWL